jgi:uncharacterized membrane protein
MDVIPDFWRSEVFHPLSVHFPIALLLMGTIFKIAALSKKSYFLSLPGTILIVTGVLGGWLAIYTGDLADGIVSRTLCDPTVLKSHENNAYNMIWIFTIAAGIDLCYYFKLINFKPKMVNIMVLILLLSGSGFLIYVSHTGANLVYNQAAGVNIPTSDCSGF